MRSIFSTKYGLFQEQKSYKRRLICHLHNLKNVLQMTNKSKTQSINKWIKEMINYIVTNRTWKTNVGSISAIN